MIPRRRVFVYGGGRSSFILSQLCLASQFPMADVIVVFLVSKDLLDRVPVDKTLENVRDIIRCLRPHTQKIVLLGVPNIHRPFVDVRSQNSKPRFEDAGHSECVNFVRTNQERLKWDSYNHRPTLVHDDPISMAPL